MSLIGSFSATLAHLAHGVTELARTDGWTNLVTGFGTSRDKTEAMTFNGRLAAMPDVQLAALYSFDDLAGRIVDTYPREEMRVGFGLAGFAPDELLAAKKYLTKFELPQTLTEARIWGNNFGGSIIWPFLDDGLDPCEPINLQAIRSVQGLRVIDRRWVLPERWYYEGPKAGWPELYRIVQPSTGGSLVTIGLIHESRVIAFPGARTEWMKKVQLRMWDLSVLEKPYDALRSAGNTWKAIETLVTDANQGVFSIKDLWQLLASDPTQGDDSAQPAGSAPSGKLLKRVRFMDMTRNVGRAIVLDLEKEKFERTQTTFTGLPDLSRAAWQRVSSASEIPVTILMGESPAGLSATGDADIRWFFAKVGSNQTQIQEPRIRQLLRILFAAQDAPKLTKKVDQPKKKAEPKLKATTPDPRRDEGSATVSAPETTADPVDDLEIVWLPLWAPTASEQADIDLKKAQAGMIWIDKQVLLPEEVALSLPENSGWKFDREAREGIINDNAQALLEERTQQAAEAAAAPVIDPNADPKEDPPQPAKKEIPE